MSRILPWIRLVSGLKYCVVFFLILVALPFTALKPMPLHSMLGGLFLELTPWAVFWLSLAFFAASWSLMSVTGVLADGLESRRPEIGSGGYLPERAARFLSVPITRGQMLFFSFAALAQCAVVVVSVSKSPGQSAVAAIAAGVVGYLVMAVLAAPAALAVEGEPPIPRWWLVDRIWALLSWLRPLAKASYRLASRVFHVLRLRAALLPDPGPPRLVGDHFYSVTTVAGLAALLGVVGWLFFPPAQRVSGPPAGAYLYVLLLLLIWVLGGLDFHLSRIRVSAVLVLLLIMALVYEVSDADHFFEARPRADLPPDQAPLDPVDVARASRAPDNLVVVASSGGGILAAGWTTLVLRQMLAARPELAGEIRMLSTASGGSVGAAYYASALGKLGEAERTSEALRQVLDTAFRKSTTSSLDATAYGLALLDFERIFVGNSLPALSEWDRGRLLEDSWKRISGDSSSLFELRPGIRAGLVPALILNSTVMETGHRLMLTPVDFRGVASRHAMTQTEFLGGGEEVDVGLWTAARLSATFPYVSPAARSRLEPREGTDPAVALHRAYHLIDGGYHDNFGITSTFDWLWPVLEARLEESEDLHFRKVLIVQLNPFAPGAPPAAARGLPSAVAGPLLALGSIRNGTQITRNETDLERGLASWQARFDSAGLEVCLKTVVLRPPKGAPDGPLSWHLTESQIETLEAAWTSVEPQWQEVKAFLEQPGCGQAATL